MCYKNAEADFSNKTNLSKNVVQLVSIKIKTRCL